MSETTVRSIVPALAALAPLTFAGCTPDIVAVPGDTPDPSIYLSGSVDLVDESVPGGPGLLFRYDCDNPPPPAGSGSPVDFVVIPEDRFVDGTAEFTFPQVPFGSCAILTGLIDRDKDFDIFYSVTNQVTAGDLAITATTLQVPEAVEGQTDMDPITGISLRAETVVPLERPAFEVVPGVLDSSPVVMSLGASPGSTPTKFLEIQTTDIASSIVDVESPLFTLVLEADHDGNGWPDDLNGDTVPDVKWPRVLLFRLDPDDPLGLTRADPPVVLPGVVLPLDKDDAFDFTDNYVLRAQAGGLPYDGASVMPVPRLHVAVPPLVVTDLATSATAPIEQVLAEGTEVAGDYQVLVMNSTGQVWQLPNELAEDGMEAQGVSFRVEAPTPPLVEPASFISGTITVGDGDPLGDATVAVFSCDDPPPPEGGGSPYDAVAVPASDFVDGVAPFLIDDVAADDCVILSGLVDRDADFFSLYSVTKLPTAGDLKITPEVVTMGAADENGLVAPIMDVALQADTVVPFDLPAFVIDSTRLDAPMLSLGPTPGSTDTVYIELQAAPVANAFADQLVTKFTVVFEEDADNSGLPDDLNGDGAPDVVWPRVLFFKLDPNDPEGIDAYPLSTVIPGVVVPLDPDDPLDREDNLILQTLDRGVPATTDTPLLTDRLRVAVPPLALLQFSPAVTAPIEELMLDGADILGDYRVLVMNSTGQVWQLPNELGAYGYESQADAFSVELDPAGSVKGIIAGEIHLGDTPPASTAVVIIDCANPPPPEGTGAPESISRIPADAFEGGVASFTFSNLEPGSCWIVTGIMDNDGDLDPLWGIANQPTAGDQMLSSFVAQIPEFDPSTGAPPMALVGLVPDAPVPIERPVFEVTDVADGDDQPTMTLGPVTGTTPTVYMELNTTDLDTPYVDATNPAFTVVFAPDADGSGLPDDYNGDGVPDIIWPRVLLVKLDPSDPYGLQTASPPVVLPGVVLPYDTDNTADLDTNLMLSAAIAGHPFDGQSPLLATRLKVAVPGLVVTDLATATTAPIEDVAGMGMDVVGDYQIVVMNSSGQTWSLPNESFAVGDFPGQTSTFRVAEPDPAAAPIGIIAGAAVLADGSTEPGGRTIVLRYDCANPPPPEGVGRPVDMTTASDFADGVGTFAFTGVAPETCAIITGFIDRDGDFDAFHDFANQTTAGDLGVGTAVVVNTPAAVGNLVPLAGPITVMFDTVVPIERPTFTVLDPVDGDSNPTMPLGANPGDSPTVPMVLSAADLDTSVVSSEGAFFTMVFAPDLNGDGMPDDFNGDTAPDVIWPRVLLQRIDPNDPLGLATVDPPIVLPGVVMPLDPTDPMNPATNQVMQAAGAGVPFDGSSVFPVDQLTVMVPGLVVTDLATLDVTPIELVAASGLPVAGDYRITVMNSSGQIWTQRNELELFGYADQGAVFSVISAAP